MPRSESGRDKPLYMISVAAELTGMHPQTLRVYEQKGLVTPGRSRGNTRLYSQNDIDRLNLINKLTDEEKKWLARIAEKSDLLKNPNPQRGRKKKLER